MQFNASLRCRTDGAGEQSIHSPLHSNLSGDGAMVARFKEYALFMLIPKLILLLLLVVILQIPIKKMYELLFFVHYVSRFIQVREIERERESSILYIYI